MTNVIGLYDNPEKARQVISQLARKGINEDELELIAQDEEDLEGHLGGFGMSQENVRLYAEAVRHGKAMVSAHTDDEHVDEVRDLFNANGALDVDELSRQFQADDKAKQDRPKQVSKDTEVIRQVEETLTVGKRKVLEGGKRVSTTVREEPVEARVTLREEKIDVQKHQSDRALSAKEANAAFKQQTRDFTETREVPDVKKVTRETGRVEITRSASEHEEVIKETVRKSEVETEDTKPEAKGR
ncbi:YsnF/AvaK domain-containing protein [Magnetospirillum sp. UT-4]|uniref:YsnF/AvaK domain-containing protein n=1 Tax=Magnetospirillum sp. UT-4 TaxID=2681467 RepID=UPI001383D73C|nr:DUF2382 domain-containing protein [Magnetospirillum sp. UT-4]CAA7625862.1 conserved hypothetical protein [Magnetospirillum sp. UT-4]